MAKKATLTGIMAVLHEAANDRTELARDLHAHTMQDTERFDQVGGTLRMISEDVKSLLETRSFSKGIWWAVTIIAGTVATAASIAIAWVRG